MEPTGDLALIGLAVMGQNLILNMNDKGYTVVAYNRTVSKVDEFLNDAAKGRKTILGAHSIEEMVRMLKKPRKIMLMVKAGKAVDDFIELLLPHLESGDCIIDGGNSHFPDTIRRTKYLESKGFLYIGTGVSGGEEGARRGPSIMPGGSPKAWPLVKDIFQATSAKTPDGAPCCEWVGENGAGHYVKMTHNGIEYGDMQLICEAYQLMKEGLGMTAGQMHTVFSEWNKGELDSYLIEITRDILAFKDADGQPLVEKIRQALLASKIVSYAQGFMLMREAAREYGWKLNYGAIALMWRGGCIIRSAFLGKIKEAFDTNPDLSNLLLDKYFESVIGTCQASWRKVVMTAVELGVPVPVFSTALAFFDSYRSARLPANLLQAQRDYFGAHTYERVDKPRGQFFHTNWTGTGGSVSSSTYTA